MVDSLICQDQDFEIIIFKNCMGYDKNMGHHLIPKFQKVWEQVEKTGLGFFKQTYVISSNCMMFVVYNPYVTAILLDVMSVCCRKVWD